MSKNVHVSWCLMAVMALLLAMSPSVVKAQYWDANANADGFLGGTGYWDTGTKNWSPTLANNTIVTNWLSAGYKDAYFAGAAGTVTLTNNVSVNSITFMTNDYVLTTSGSGAISWGAPYRITLAGTGTTNTVALVLNGQGLNIVGTGVLLVKTNIQNSTLTPITVSGGSTVVLSAANAAQGTMTLVNGSWVLSGLNGLNSFSCPYSINAGGMLVLDNTDAANNTNRVANASILTLNGGTIYFANGGGSSNFLERLGTNVLNVGASTIQADQAAGTSALVIDKLVRSNGATVNFSGPGLGLDAKNRIVISAAPTLDDGIIGGWATAGNEFAKYDPTTVTSVTALVSGDYTAHTEPNWVASDNVKLTTGSTSLTGTRQINSLNLAQAGDVTIDLAGQTLRTESGGLLVSGNFNAVVTNGTLTAGTGTDAAGELIIHQNAAANPMVVASVIANNGAGAVGLTKSGAGALRLTGQNTYTGPTFVNASTLFVTTANGISSNSGASVASGATLDLGGFGASLGSVAGLGLVTNLTSLTLGYDNTAPVFSGTIATTGQITKVGTGMQVMSNVVLGTGGLLVKGNMLLTSTSNRFSNTTSPYSITIDGGTLWVNAVGLQTGGAQIFGTTNMPTGTNAVLLANGGTLAWTNGSQTGLGRTIDIAPGSTGVIYVASGGANMTYGSAIDGRWLRGAANTRVEKRGLGTYTIGSGGFGNGGSFSGAFVIVEGKCDLNNNSDAYTFGVGQLVVQPGAEFYGSKKSWTLTNAVINGGILSTKGNDGSTGWGRILDTLNGTTTLSNDGQIIVARANSSNYTNSGNDVFFNGDLVVASPTNGSLICFDNTAFGLTNANSRLTWNGVRTFTVDDGAAPFDLDVSVAIQTNTASASLVKAGLGTMRMAWINPCHGAFLALGGVSSTNVLGTVVVSNGTLLVDSTLVTTGAVTVLSGGTLGGTGTIAGAVTVNASGTLMGRTTTNAFGTLTLTTNLVLNGALSVRAGATASDVVTVQGTVTLGASSSLTVTGTNLNPNATYTFLQSANPIQGTYGSVNANGWRVDYGNPNSLVLYRPPSGFLLKLK